MSSDDLITLFSNEFEKLKKLLDQILLYKHHQFHLSHHLTQQQVMAQVIIQLLLQVQNLILQQQLLL